MMTNNNNHKSGSVTLVGAGPYKDLITLAGLKAIKSGEVIIYDDLIDPETVAFAPKDAELIYVGKRFSEHSLSQEEIQSLLIEKAREGRNVVRLKGGDGYVFGRGGEEMIALKNAGIHAEIIPGITTGVAVPEHLGIPVTHRGMSQSVTFITGHSAGDLTENYEALAHLDGTLIFFMGIHNAPEIASRLMEHGKSADTPAAILCNGYRSNEKKITGRLGDIEELVKNAKTPALLLVGPVAELDLRSAAAKPLQGVSVTVTGTESFAAKMSDKLTALGAYVRTIPGIEIRVNENALPDDFSGYAWIAFTSSNGIRAFFDLMKEKGRDIRSIAHLKFACIGAGTKDSLLEYGIRADLVPADYTAECLGRELPIHMEKGEKLLILRAANGSKLLNAELDRAGITYTDIALYESAEIRRHIENKQEAATDYIVFGSALGAKSYLKDHSIPKGCKAVCIGEATAKALEGCDFLLPKEHTAEAIAERIVEDVNGGKP